MGEIDKNMAFSLVIKALDTGNEKLAKRLMRIIARSIQQENRNKLNSSKVLFDNADDAHLFGELVLRFN